MFEQCFKNIDDILFKDAGASNELDYVEQTSWLLFLKYLEDLEKNKAMLAELNGQKYTPILDTNYTWSNWAYPVNSEGKLDHNKAMTGDDLKNFVDLKLFPYLKKFKENAESPDTLEYKIGEIFGEVDHITHLPVSENAHQVGLDRDRHLQRRVRMNRVSVVFVLS